MKFTTTVNINGLKNSPSVFARHINQASKKIEGKLIADARKETPKDEGEAQNSFKGFHVVSGFRALIEVTNDAPYFAVLENGRKAGKKQPPSGEGSLLYKWVVKNINPENPRSVSYLVARAIGERGLPAHKPMEKSLNNNRRFIQNTLDNAVENGVKQING